MNLTTSFFRLRAAHAMVAAMLGWCTVAHAFPGMGNMGTVSSSTASPSLPAGSSKAYVGRFKGSCVEMEPGSTLAFVDILTLQPVDDKTVSVAMEKFIYSTLDCQGDTLIGSVIVPSGTWKLESQVKLGERLADRVTIHLPEGKITTKGKPAAKAQGRLETIGGELRLHYGNGKEMSMSIISPEAIDKGTRWVGPDRLLVEDPSANSLSLLESAPFMRLP
jgi:hypothetical protein